MRRKIIVIGGGVAGLAAASRLHDCEVTLLEAKDRFGGRIHTLQSAGQVVELGAEFVHGQSKALLQTICDAGLATQSISDSNFLFENGKLQPTEVWDKFSQLTERIEPEKRDQSFLSFVDAQGLPERDRKMMLAFATGFNAAHAERLSAHSLKRAEFAAKQMGGDEQARAAQGYGALVEFLVACAREAGVRLLLDTVVREVHWQPGRVEIEAVRWGRAERFLADAAIITLPLGVLKSHDVVFHPSLSEKEEAIAGLEFGNVTKLTFVFRDTWWPQGDFGFIHSLDEPLPTWWSDARGPVITGWAGGAKADVLVSKSAQELEILGLNILARIFSTLSEKIHAHLVSCHSHNWARDPHIRGAYSYIPVNGLFMPKLLAQPVEDTLFFAGEATAQDAQLGTVFAALESGYREADAVCECLRS